MPSNAPTPSPGSAATRTRLGRDKLSRSINLSIADGVVSVPIISISAPANVFVTALVTQLVPLPLETIGILSALPFAGSFLQLGVTPFLMRCRSAWAISMLAGVAHLLTWVSLVFLLPFLPDMTPGEAGRWLILWSFVKCVISAISSVGWNVWMREWIPVLIRGRFFARRNSITKFAELVYLPITGWLLTRGHYSARIFQSVVIAAIVLRIVSLVWIWISPARHGIVRMAGPALRGQFGILRASPSFLTFIAFGALFTFATSSFGTFYHIFMYKPLGYDAWDVSVLSNLARLSGVLSLPAWGRLIDRHGNRAVMIFSMVLCQGLNFSWCFITPHNRSLLYSVWILTGATGSGVLLGQITLLLKLIPEQAKDIAIGVNVAVTALFGTIGPLIGGRFLAHTIQSGTDPVTTYHLCFLLQPVLSLLAVLLLLRVHETGNSMPVVIRSMRDPRNFWGILGLGWIWNWIPRTHARNPSPP